MSVKNLIAVLLLLLAGLYYFSYFDVQSSPITIGLNDWTGYDPLIIAESKSLFKKHGVNVIVKRFKSGQDEMQAMRDGKIVGGGFTLDEAVTLHQSGFKVKAILVVDFSLGGDMLLGQSSIKDMSMIRGKKVGYEGSLVGEFLLHRALEENQMRVQDITLVEVKGEDWLDYFRAGKVDALVSYNPDSTTLINLDRANLLFSSKDIPGEIIDVLVFEEKFYNKNKSALKKVASAWFETIDYIESNIYEAAEIISKEKHISAAEYLKAQTELNAPNLSANRELFDGSSEKNIYKFSQVIIDFMLDKGLLSSRVNTDEFFASDILNIQAVNE